MTRETLDRLIEETTFPCVSIYLPTVEAGAETQQNSIRFKNQLATAETMAQARGVESSALEGLLAPARALLDNFEFWQHQSAGLAVFLTGGEITTHRLAFDPSEVVTVHDRPYVKPLLPLLTGDGRFYLLAASQKQVRFFEGSRSAIRPLEIPDMPASLDAALGSRSEAPSLQLRTSSGSAGGAPIYHGHGAGDDDQKGELQRFLRRVDDAIRGVLAGSDAPLVVAAVERTVAAFHQVTHLSHVLEEGVLGNPDDRTPQELHAAAWPLVAPTFEAQRDEAHRQYRQLSETERTTTDLEAIVDAATFGRVETLFVSQEGNVWGSFVIDGPATRIERHDERRPGDRDLVEEAALQALRHGSRVFALPAAALPDGAAAAAAVLRF
ncbi:MAG: hypothetical protein AAGN46_11655 [Acidobacteriota bacterium]